MSSGIKFFLSSPPSSPAIRITSRGRSFIGFLRHDALSNQDTLGWAYDAPDDETAQLALDCLLARGERTIPGAVYQGNESELEMDAAIEAEDPDGSRAAMLASEIERDAADDAARDRYEDFRDREYDRRRDDELLAGGAL